MKNKYYFFRNDQKKEFFEIDPQNSSCLDHVNYKYFGRVLYNLASRIPDSGLIIYVTAWTVHELPSYGSNVIVFILQDEFGRSPIYRNKVGAIFKTCGSSPIVPEAFGYGTAIDQLSILLAQTKHLMKDVRSRFKDLFYKINAFNLAPIIKIPLGYYAKDDITYIPIKDRKHDLYFAGSIQHIKKKPFSFRRPKESARARMAKNLQKLKQEHPQIDIKSNFTSGYRESVKTDNRLYLQNMMNTKLCPIPRGANLETYRFYEALQYGCIPIGECFPDAWYYNGAPIIRLKNWNDLTKTTISLLNDQNKIDELHRLALKWWDENCSEKSVAAYIHLELSNNKIV